MTQISEMPWNSPALRDWMIVGLNHYRQHGARNLCVAMTKGSRCIQAEGLDERNVFARLVKQAEALNDADC